MVMRRFTMPENVHPLVKELAKICMASGMNLQNISKAAGFTPSIVHTWFNRHSPSINNFDTVLNLLGYQLHITRIDDFVCPACGGKGEATTPITGVTDACGLCAFRAEAAFDG